MLLALLRPRPAPRTPPPRGCAPPEIVAALSRWHAVSRVPEPETWIVPAEDDGKRLAYAAAAAYPALGSKSQAESAVKKGRLLVNGASAEPSRRVRVGDELQLTLPPAKPLSAAKLASHARFTAHLLEQGLRTVYEDADVAVVYKPPGIHTKRGTNQKYAALEDALPAVLRPPSAEVADALPLPLAMHRLDVPVAGLLLVGKTRAGALSLSRQLEGRGVRKVYHALLVGSPPAAEMALDAPVDGMEARSTLTVLDEWPHPQWGALTRVRLEPHTGRTHQLRRHVAGIGCPIVGDDLYWAEAAEERERGGGPPLPPLRRSGSLFLQSCAVALERPRDDGALAVCVAEAAKFAALLRRAERGSAFPQDGPSEE